MQGTTYLEFIEPHMQRPIYGCPVAISCEGMYQASILITMWVGEMVKLINALAENQHKFDCHTIDAFKSEIDAIDWDIKVARGGVEN